MSSTVKLYKEIVEIEQILKNIVEINKQVNEVKKNISNESTNTDTIISFPFHAFISYIIKFWIFIFFH